MSEKCKIIFILNSSEDSIKLLNNIRALATKGYRRFDIYIISQKDRPYYLKDLIPLLQNNILYGLNIYYAGSSKTDLEKFAEFSARELNGH